MERYAVNSFNGVVNFKDVIAVYPSPLYSITNGAVDRPLTIVLFISRRGKPITIIFDQKYNRQVPNRSHVYSFMKITLAGADFAGVNQCGFVPFAQCISQGNTIRQRHLRAQVRYHTNDLIFLCTEMERAVAPFSEA